MTDDKKTNGSEVQLPAGGIPGLPQVLQVVFGYADGDPRNEPPGGKPGKYKLVFTLSRPRIRPLAEYANSFEKGLKGDSHLAILPPAYTPPSLPSATQIRIYDHTQDWQSVVCEGLPNDAGFLQKIVIPEIQAEGFNDAETKGYDIINRALTNLSVHLDVPLTVFQFDAVELRTGNSLVRFVAQYLEVPLAMGPVQRPSPEFQACASFHREALAAANPLYQYLCLYKLVDGILVVRKRRRREAEKAKQPFSRPEERMPAEKTAFLPYLHALYSPRPPWDDLALDSIFRPEALGRAFSDLLQNELRVVRNDIAHAITERTNDLVSADDVSLQYRAISWLPLLKVIGRRMMKNEFPGEFLSYLQEDGTIVASAVAKPAGT